MRPLARPPLPPLDPLNALVPGVVPEKKRFCSGCDTPLKRDGGFCPKCGQEYSFKPLLAPGDMVADKYEIKGTIAFGGLGWIYLALDKVLNRWVTLKGLLNSKDPRMLQVAVQEREYLAAVKHPNIVGIYDFVTHQVGEHSSGFIVMEYVNGKTLMTLRKEHGGPLPVVEAISYIAEILPALGYLDEMGLVYCDFKPENVMVEEDTVKLIDLGAVRPIDATGGDIYGSKGYTAPEAHDAPTPISDLYSAARALAVLVASFDFQGKYESRLPGRDENELFKKNEALHRFLLKATRAKPAERFQSAAEMGEQLVGVLHSILGESSDLGRIESAIFEPDGDLLVDSDAVNHVRDGIPRLLVDKEDEAAAVIVAAGALGDPERRRKLFSHALKTHAGSIELRLRLVDELVTLGQFKEAESHLAEVQNEHPTDWRLGWYRGRALLAQGKTEETLAAFESILGELPGELAPQHALGRAHEQSGSLDRAIEYYDAVSRADGSFTTAAMALGRCLERRKNKAAAAEAYRRVPPSSNRYAHAQLALARLLVSDMGGEPALDDIEQAATAIESLDGLMDGIEVHRTRAALFLAAAKQAQPLTGSAKLPKGNKGKKGKAAARSDLTLLRVPFEKDKLRSAAENELRTCARFASGQAERIRWVDAANAARPLTWT